MVFFPKLINTLLFSRSTRTIAARGYQRRSEDLHEFAIVLYFISWALFPLKDPTGVSLAVLSPQPPSFLASYRLEFSSLFIDEVSRGAVLPAPLSKN